jgi:hypothetical protein
MDVGGIDDDSRSARTEKNGIELWGMISASSTVAPFRCSAATSCVVSGPGIAGSVGAAGDDPHANAPAVATIRAKGVTK